MIARERKSVCPAGPEFAFGPDFTLGSDLAFGPAVAFGSALNAIPFKIP
jgi:hypothetical protein